MSEILLAEHPELQSYFPSRDRVPSGICSIQLSPDSPPWIICPRRLLYMGNRTGEKIQKGMPLHALFTKCNFSANERVGVWAETKVKYSEKSVANGSVSFDYTFDYVLCRLGRVSLRSASVQTGISENELKRKLSLTGHTFTCVDGELTVEDFPVGTPFIVEVMTSSTSGGNKRIRSCIPQAFEDCVLGKSHIAPGINYRQVWARMVSQMIVKSQAAIAWGGRTIWIFQDLLADYISTTTALNLKRFVATALSEVNILSFSHPGGFNLPKDGEIIRLVDPVLFAGPIRPHADKSDISPSFQDIVLASVCPPKSALFAALCNNPLSNILLLE